MSSSPSPAALATRLARHFSAGAVIAAASPFIAADHASAAVQYTAVNWVVPNNIDGLYINVETLATGSAGTAVAGWDINPYSATSLTWFNATGTGMLRYPGLTTGSAGNLALGTIVGPTGSYGSGAVTVGSAAGNWQVNSLNRFGFRFVAADGQTRYGWGTFQIGASISGADRKITEIAWETTANTPIAVGDTGSGGTPPYDPCATSNASVVLGSNNFYMAANAADLAVGGMTITAANYFRFTPPYAGEWTFSTCASGAATRMAILDACTAGAGVIASNDSTCGASAEVRAVLAAGTTVFVVVGGEGAALSSPQRVDAVGPGTSCSTAIVASEGLNSISSSPGSGADQPVYTNAAQTLTATVFNAQWFSFTPTVTGLFTLRTCNSGDTRLAIGTACAATGTFGTIAYNDDAPTCLTGAGGQAWGSWLDATNNGGDGLPLTQNLVAGTTYSICVGGYGDGNFISGALEIIGPGGLPYDPCRPTNPTAGPGVNSLAYDINAGNLDLLGGSCNFVLYAANYYKYLPTTSGTHTFDTCGAGANTRIAVLDACGAGAAVLGCNDDSCGLGSSVTLNLSLNVPVYVVIGSWSATAELSTPISLEVTLPPDELCVNASVATYGDNPISSSASAGLNRLVYTDAAQTTTIAVNNAQWFAFTPTATGPFVIKACDAGDTRLAIGTTCAGSGAAFHTIAYNDDAPTCLDAPGSANSYGSWIDATNNGATGGFAGFPLTQDLVAGQTYYICVGGFGTTTTVSGFLNISGPQGNACPADLDGDGTVGAPDLAVLLGNWGGTGSADLDGDGSVGAPDLAEMLGAWGACL
ncbi:MAG: hypothetical protein RL325_490 [Planctomycetota bacterium]